MTYAHIINNEIVAIGSYPEIERTPERDWDLRDPATRTARGWIEVVETPRPADTDTGTYDSDVQLVEGIPTRVWVYRDWTEAEIISRMEAEEARIKAESDQMAIEAVVQEQEQVYDAAAPVDWATLTDRVAPGQRVIWNTNTYRNKSGAWLPTTVTPDQAQWWAQETGLPAEIEAWAAGQSVSTGDLRTYEGTTYSCIQAHTTQLGWEPPAVPALWSAQ